MRSFDTSTAEGRSRERYRRVGLTVLASGAARGIGILTTLISIPLTVSYLGTERYGLWVTITSVIALLTFADLGLGNGILNAVSEAHGREDQKAAQRYVSSGFFMLLGIGLIAGLCFGLVYGFVPWSRLFNVSSAVAAQEAGPAMAIFFVCFALSIPFGIVQRVQLGYQEGFISSLWQALGGVLGLAGILIVIRRQAGLPWLVLAVAGAATLATAANWLTEFRWSKPWLWPQWRLVDWQAGRKLARLGALFLVLQVSAAVAFASDNIIATQVLGASAAAHYSVAQRIFMIAPLLMALIIGPLWPAYGEALARGDRGWVRRTFYGSLVFTLSTCAVLAGVLVLLSGPIFSHWVGPKLVPSAELALGLAIWSVMYTWGTTVAMLLNAASIIAFQVVTALALAISSVALKVILISHLGIAGLAWALILSYTVVVFVPTSVYLTRWFRRAW